MIINCCHFNHHIIIVSLNSSIIFIILFVDPQGYLYSFIRINHNEHFRIGFFILVYSGVQICTYNSIIWWPLLFSFVYCRAIILREPPWAYLYLHFIRLSSRKESIFIMKKRLVLLDLIWLTIWTVSRKYILRWFLGWYIFQCHIHLKC